MIQDGFCDPRHIGMAYTYGTTLEMALHLYTHDDPPHMRDVEKVVRLLEKDGVIAFPSSGNWSFGCDATSSKALDRILQLKPQRDKSQLFALGFASISMAADYVHIHHAAYRLLRKAWPGPYTVILEAVRNLPRQLKDKKRKTIGAKVPESAFLRAVVETLGKPLATTSVPHDTVWVHKGRDQEMIPISFGYEVMERFGHGIDLLIDFGDERSGLESTVIDLSGETVEVIRKGKGPLSLLDIEE